MRKEKIEPKSELIKKMLTEQKLDANDRFIVIGFCVLMMMRIQVSMPLKIFFILNWSQM